MRRALAVSSNVYFFSIGGGYQDQKGMGISNIEKYSKMFGFGSPTGIDLFGEVIGNVPSPKWKSEVFDDEVWRLGDTYNSSIGQYGFLITPIQAVRAIASIANGGVLKQPTIKFNNFNSKGDQKINDIDQNKLKIIKEGLRLAVTEGTAIGLSMPGIEVAAKTGTAELGTTKQEVNSWVIGYFPYQNPKYAFVVTMESGPRSNQIGATYVMRQLFEWMYIYTPEYLNVNTVN